MHLRSLFLCATVGSTMLLPVFPITHGESSDFAENGFGRVIAGCAFSRNNDYSSSFIIGISGGGIFGDHMDHEINIECFLSAWKTTRHDSTGTFVSKNTERHIPVLLNYRYYIIAPRHPVSIFVGAGLGCDFISNDFAPRKEPEIWWENEEDGWLDNNDIAFAAAGAAGFLIRLGNTVGIEAGYRCIWMSGAAHLGYENNRHTIWTRREVIHLVSASLQISF